MSILNKPDTKMDFLIHGAAATVFHGVQVFQSEQEEIAGSCPG